MGSAEGLSFTTLIPARFGSTRLPGKPLADLAGLPMVVHVARRARESGATRVVVVTDDERVVVAVRAHGFDAIMSGAQHPTGTDRLAEAVVTLGLPDTAIVVNVQGDEPLIDPVLIGEVARLLASRADAAIATACHPLVETSEFFDPNVVKVILDARGDAVYFSRAPIPWARDAFTGLAAKASAPGAVAWQGFPAALPPGLPVYRHFGLYAYRAATLRAFAQLAPAAIERFEALEQLRAIWHGYRVAVQVSSSAAAPGVDSAADLARVRVLMAAREAATRG